jgi:hypothetical protein
MTDNVLDYLREQFARLNRRFDETDRWRDETTKRLVNIERSLVGIRHEQIDDRERLDNFELRLKRIEQRLELDPLTNTDEGAHRAPTELKWQLTEMLKAHPVKPIDPSPLSSPVAADPQPQSAAHPTSHAQSETDWSPSDKAKEHNQGLYTYEPQTAGHNSNQDT